MIRGNTLRMLVTAVIALAVGVPVMIVLRQARPMRDVIIADRTMSQDKAAKLVFQDVNELKRKHGSEWDKPLLSTRKAVFVEAYTRAGLLQTWGPYAQVKVETGPEIGYVGWIESKYITNP